MNTSSDGQLSTANRQPSSFSDRQLSTVNCQPSSLTVNVSPSGRYAELHCISNFTFLRGASHPGELVDQAHRLGYSALALTDECSMAGVVRAHEAARDCGLKLIVGAEFRTSNGMHMVLLAPTRKAYAQICQLITQARRQAPKGEYRLSNADMQDRLDECLALWAPSRTPLISQALWVKRHFPQRAWIAVELHRHGDDGEYLARLQTLGERC